MNQRLRRFLIGAVAAYLGVLLFMYGYQRHLLYHPHKDLNPPASYDLAMETLTLDTADRVRITAWYAKPPKPDAPVLVYFHGNAGHLGKRADDFRAFLKEGFGLLAISYRGYGTSEGSPTEGGLYNDARAALAYLKAQGIAPRRTVLYGESLGTGVATQMALEYEARALVLEAPYTSVAARGQAQYPFLPVSLLLKDRFDNLGKVGKVGEPVLILHGGRDAVVPTGDGRAVYAAAHEPKGFILFPDNGHDNANVGEIARIVKEFVANVP